MHFKYFDAHTHIHFPAYEKDRDEVISHAIEQEVGMVTVGTTLKTSVEAVEVAKSFLNIWAVVGVHPVHASEAFHDADEMGRAAHGEMKHPAETFDRAAFHKLAEEPRVVAIGECGLDYFRLEGDGKKEKEEQRNLFIEQIRFAHAVKKPLMIHCRSAFPDLLVILKEEKKYLATNAGIIHFFSGTLPEAEQLLELGFSFTFGGVLTFTSDYDAVVRSIPIDRILSETDAPYVSPAPYRGKRNQPAYVVHVAKRLAELKAIPEEEMAGQILANAERIFSIKLS